jgi:hypothetical protein
VEPIAVKRRRRPEGRILCGAPHLALRQRLQRRQPLADPPLEQRVLGTSPAGR